MGNIKQFFSEINKKLQNLKSIPKATEVFLYVSNSLEKLFQYINELKQENQELKDEVNRLKWEQWKPDILPDKKDWWEQKDKPNNISSDKDRKDSKPKNKKTRKWKTKKNHIKIDRQVKCIVDKSLLPKDAINKWYVTKVCQDIIITTDNVEFKQEVFYSPSEKKTYYWPIPKWYEWDYWPWVKALTISLKHAWYMSEPNILKFINTTGIIISKTTITKFLIKDKDLFHDEKDDIYLAGLASTQYQQTDDTSERVNGENYKQHIMCNLLYSAYFTSKNKSRLIIIDLLMNFIERKYIFNSDTIKLLEKFKISKAKINLIAKKIEKWKIFLESELDAELNKIFPKLWKNTKLRIQESFAIAYYQQQSDFPIVKILICDDAPQFKYITKFLGLCWIHDGRHYKKLIPIMEKNIKKLEDFGKKYWYFYKALLKYKEAPTEQLKYKLSNRFDRLFSIKTGYEDLDKRIAMTKDKKLELLLVLKFPKIPIHNNAAELAVRVQVRKRDISLQTRTEEWTKAKNTFLTIIETARKLWVNTYDYIYDRITQKYEMISLADIIIERSQ